MKLSHESWAFKRATPHCGSNKIRLIMVIKGTTPLCGSNKIQFYWLFRVPPHFVALIRADFKYKINFFKLTICHSFCRHDNIKWCKDNSDSFASII